MFKVLSGCLMLVWSSLTFADTTQIAAQIDQLIKANYAHINLGMMVLDAKTKQIIYEKNADHYFMPASNQKLFTAYAVLQYLPNGFTYPTYLFADLSKVQQGILNDNVYLKLTGDPTFNYAQLTALLMNLSANHINKIAGRFIVDDSAFDKDAHSKGTSWDDRQFCYGSPNTASMLNHNCITVQVAPGRQINTIAQLQLPTYPHVYFKNAVITVPDTQLGCGLNVISVNASNYKIEGCIHLSAKPKPIKLAITNPQKNFSDAIRFILDTYHIQLSQPVQFTTINHPVKLLAINQSPPLPILITLMLKNSDNTIANALFKTLGAYFTHAPGSFSNGQQAIHFILNSALGLTLPAKTLFDGDGVSRYNFLTARQVAILLTKIYDSPFRQFVMDALPIAGKDGTLKQRMQTTALVDKVHAKTGTETAVSALSGYLTTEKDRTLIFVILVNGFTEKPSAITALEDQICLLLAKLD